MNHSCNSVREFVNGVSCPKGNNGKECSGQGECTTTYQCHCDPGWKGQNCSVKDDGNSSKFNEEKPGIVKGMGPEQRDSTSNTTALVGGLVTFVLIVSVFFVAMAFRYLPSRPPKEDSAVYPPHQQDSAPDPERNHQERSPPIDGEVHNHNTGS